MKNAFRIFFYNGWKRELLIIGIVLLTGAVEGVGIASLWPIVGLDLGGTARDLPFHGQHADRGRLEEIGLPLTVEVLLGVIVVVSAAALRPDGDRPRSSSGARWRRSRPGCACG